MIGKKLIAAVVAGIFLMSCVPVFAAEIPDYTQWEFCAGSSKANVRVKICFDSQPYFADHIITLYSERDTGRKALLIWRSYERSKIKFEMHDEAKSYEIERVTFRFYRDKNGAWELVETKKLSRSAFPKNKPIPVFENDSLFGREFHLFMEAMGYKDVTPPVFIFMD